MNPLIDHLIRLHSESVELHLRQFLFHQGPSEEEEALVGGDPFSWYFPIEEYSDEDKMSVTNYTTYHEICLLLLVDNPKLNPETFAVIYRRTKEKVGQINGFRIYVYDLCAAFFKLAQNTFVVNGEPQMGVFYEKLVKLFPALLVESDELRRLKYDFTSERGIATFLTEMEDLYFAEYAKHLSLARDFEERNLCDQFIPGTLTPYLEAKEISADEDYVNFEKFASDIKSTRLFVTLEAPLFIRGRRIIPTDQDSFFNQLRIDKVVPYASTTYDDERKRIMVFAGSDGRKGIPYRRMVKTKKRDERAYVIELFVRMPIESVERNPFYYSAIVDFQTGKVQIRIQSVIYERYAADLTKIFSGLGAEISVGKFSVVSTSSQIMMTVPDDFKFKDYVFHHLIMTNPLFRNTLFFSERATPAAKRKGVKFYCVPFGGKEIRNHKGELYTDPVAVSLSVFTQTNIDGRESVRVRLFLSKVTQKVNFVSDEVVRCLLYYYVGLKYSIPEMPTSLRQVKRIDMMYRDADLLSPEAETKKSVSAQGMRKNKLQLQVLQQDYSHVFGMNYMMSCKGKAVPYVFLEEEGARQALQERFLHGREEVVEPIPFPDTENPEFWVVSLNNKFPYVILVPNADEKTQISYPLVPCASDKLPKKLRYVPKKTREYIGTADKFLEPGSFRQGNETLVNLLGVEFLNSYGVNYHERNEKTSLLHCFLFTMDWEYRSLFVGRNLEEEIIKSNDRREVYLANARKKLRFNASLCKQELYDQTEEDISKLFANDETFLDSALFYRVLEEYFADRKINIFVFTNEKDETGSRKLRLEIPRSSTYHYREVHFDRESLILIRNYGPTSLLREAGLTYPQYEIVCQRINKEPQTLLFGKKVTAILYNTLRQSQKSVVWRKEQGVLSRLEGMSFAHHWSKKLNGTIISQFIDAAGYTRIINFAHELGRISVVVPPSQPLNCPTVKAINRATEDTARTIFGKPSGCSFVGLSDQRSTANATGSANPVVIEGKVQGLWFPYLGIKAGIFCPIKHFTSDLYEEIASDPFQEISFKNSPVNEIIALQNQAAVIKQLVVWLYVVAGKPTVGNYIASYFKSGSVERADYDFSRLPSVLPDAASPAEALDYIAKYAPDFVSEGKLYFATSSLYERVVYFIRQHEKNPFQVDRIDSIQPVERSAMSNRGFVKIFKSRLDFENWIDDVEENRGKTLQVQKKFTEATFHKKLLFVAKLPDGYFLVKNLPENSRMSDAERYGANWIETGLFDGYRIPNKKYPIMQYVVTSNQEAEYYSQSGDLPGGLPVVEGEPFVRVLVYGNAREIIDERESHAYAVLLPLSYSP